MSISMRVAGWAFVLALLAGCASDQPTGRGANSRPYVPLYPELTQTYDTSARFVVVGVDPLQRTHLTHALSNAGYTSVPSTAVLTANAVVTVPDRIIDIRVVENSVDFAEGQYWVTCHLRVRVRKPMRTSAGQTPVVDAGTWVDVWAQSAATGQAVSRNQGGNWTVAYPKCERELLKTACGNLLKNETFRQAMELK